MQMILVLFALSSVKSCTGFHWFYPDPNGSFGPWRAGTIGSPFPKPKSVVTQQGYFEVNPDNFQFEVYKKF